MPCRHSQSCEHAPGKSIKPLPHDPLPGKPASPDPGDRAQPKVHPVEPRPHFPTPLLRAETLKNESPNPDSELANTNKSPHCLPREQWPLRNLAGINLDKATAAAAAAELVTEGPGWRGDSR